MQKKKPKPRKKRTGRPPAKISLKRVESLAALFCTDSELATGLGVNRATVARRKRTPAFQEAVMRGRDRGKTSLRRWQMQNARRGNIAAQIWLGKQLLGQKDKVFNEHGLGAGAEGALTSALDRLFARLDRHAERAAQGAVPGV